MKKINEVQVLRVFTNQRGNLGNPVGIILDDKRKIKPRNRQRIASSLGFSESVFINNLRKADVSIYNPESEINFSGHAMVGIAYYINQVLKQNLKCIECHREKTLTWQEGECSWISLDVKNISHWNLEQYEDVSSVENFSSIVAKTKKHTMIWAWISKEDGTIRARTFAPDWGIPEDEANGSGSMQLALKLGCKLEINHGQGSIIYAKPLDNGFVAVGGMIKVDNSLQFYK